jgi:release factor glutamine methyltransferase
MKFKELAAKFINDLASPYDDEEAQAIFLIALNHYFKYSRADYLLKKEEEILPHQLLVFETVLQELQTGKPIQYILGETLFYGLTFKVNEFVLIPRPETEELVEWVLEKLTLHAPRPTLNILDIGTGSGCIAISLKKNMPNADVTALDISSKALAIAKQNALLNEVNISFVEEDILKSHISYLKSQISVIVSNPPYITQTEKAQMHENVLANEPHSALFVSNERPLVFYEAIADFALINLEETGLLFFEINEYLGNETIEMLRGKGFKNIELKKDMQGKDRMLCCNSTAP